MDKKQIEKELGFALPPHPVFEGNFKVFPDVIEATCVCKLCSTPIVLLLHGQTFNSPMEQIQNRITERLRARHECPAVKEIMSGRQDKYFKDILRGGELLNEEKYKIKRGLQRPDGKFIAKA